MTGRNDRDLIGGALMFATGAGYAVYAVATYRLGSLSMMGPGLFPAILGTILAGLGVCIAVPAFFRHGAPPEVRVRAPLVILASVAAFALILPWFGLLPAIAGSVVVATFADDSPSLLRPVGIIVFLSLLTWLVFNVGLGQYLVLFRWPL